MKIGISHLVHPHTTGNYIRKHLGLSHKLNYLSESPAWLSLFYKGLDINEFIYGNHIKLLLYIDPFDSLPIGLNNLNIPTAIYLIDIHQNLEQRLQLAYFFDYVFIAQKDYLTAFKEQGIVNIFWLPLACDVETHLYSTTTQEKIYDIGFVGNRGLLGSERRNLLDNLEQNFKVNDLNRQYLPDEIGTIYSQSQIVFNWSVNGDVNMRVFEALCSGRLLLTNAIPNGLEELFVDRKHLVIYHDAEELLKLARYYLNHADEREAIAQAGQAEVLAKHTYKNRSKQILTTIFGSGEPQLIAQIRTCPAKKRWQAYAKALENLRQPLAVLKVAHQAWQEGESSWGLGVSVVKAALRAINVRVPLTPNALRHRWKVLRSNV